MKIIMLPCAGGNGLMFQSMSGYLSECLESIIYDYPGHGRRIQLSLLTSLKEIANDFIEEMKKIDLFNGQSYVLLGYSMGSLVCYEVVHRLIEENLKLPEHLFLCASSTKYIEKYERNISYPNEELYSYLKELGGTSNELLENKEFQEFYFPIIKSDLLAIDTYQNDISILLPVHSTILYGSKDRYSDSEVQSWKNYIQVCSFSKIEGGHFFLYESEIIMVQIIIETVKRQQYKKWRIKNE